MEKIKSYKGFDKNLSCRGFQYEVGKTYEMPEEDVEVCEIGFHACESPLDVLDYYFLDDDCEIARFCEVEQSGKIDKKEDGSTKIASSRIEIKAELKFADLLRLGIEWIKDSVTKVGKGEEKLNNDSRFAQIGSSGYSAKIGSSGVFAQIGSSGYSAKIGSSGDCARIGSSGDFAQIGSSGDFARIGSSGYSARIGSSGDSARIGSSGDSARIGSSGNSARIGSSGNCARINSSGEDSVICCAGHGGKVKAKKGSWVTLSEWRYDKEKGRNVPLKVVTFQIDGEKYKEDRWYALRGGEVIDVTEG
jgi:hypothetical protein